jgi:magnesium transporter
MLQIYKSLESGPLQELTLKTLEKGAWINIVDPTPYELKVVSNLTEVDPDFLRSALDDEERSHTDVEENSVMVLTNVPVFRGEDSYDALPLAIIVTDEFIITVCLEETPVITEFNERTSRLFRTYKKTRFLFQILYKSATYFLRYLRQISKLSEEIEDQLRHDMKNSEILRLLELQKGLTYFNAAIRSNGAVLDKLLRMRNNTSLTPILKAYEEDEDLLEDVIIENKQAKEMVEMYSKILARLADTFSSIISNNQNLVMKFLAAMTIILAIPTVVSSFFGMNVPVPFAARLPLRHLHRTEHQHRQRLRALAPRYVLRHEVRDKRWYWQKQNCGSASSTATPRITNTSTCRAVSSASKNPSASTRRRACAKMLTCTRPCASSAEPQARTPPRLGGELLLKELFF